MKTYKTAGTISKSKSAKDGQNGGVYEAKPGKNSSAKDVKVGQNGGAELSDKVGQNGGVYEAIAKDAKFEQNGEVCEEIATYETENFHGPSNFCIKTEENIIKSKKNAKKHEIFAKNDQKILKNAKKSEISEKFHEKTAEKIQNLEKKEENSKKSEEICKNSINFNKKPGKIAKTDQKLQKLAKNREKPLSPPGKLTKSEIFHVKLGGNLGQNPATTLPNPAKIAKIPQTTDLPEHTIIGIDPGLQNLGIGIIHLVKNPIIEPSLIGKRVKKEVFEPAKMAEFVASYQYALIKINPTRSLHEKLFFIFEKMCEIFELYSPKLVILEDAFIGINKNSGLKLGLARGAILTAIGKFSINFETLPPKQIKAEVTCKGTAEKHEIQASLAKLLPNLPSKMPFDSSDALAAALCGIKFFRNK